MKRLVWFALIASAGLLGGCHDEPAAPAAAGRGSGGGSTSPVGGAPGTGSGGQAAGNAAGGAGGGGTPPGQPQPDATAPEPLAPDASAADAPGPITSDKTTVVLFLIDGLQDRAVKTAIAAGAKNLADLLAHGVRVENARSPSPAAVIQLPAGSPGGIEPWGHATAGNVAVHTGCHVYESRQMDDIFLAARAAGIKSVFSGGDDNYAVFTTPDFHYGMRMDDATAVAHAIDHLEKDGVRLLRLHLQRVRDFWTGPGDVDNPASAYIRHVVEVDALLGQLIAALEAAGVWPRTYLVVSADHGMGQASASAHPPVTPSSWQPFMAFRGPDLKQGATIPYAELPDIAVTTMRFFGLPPLKGHLDPQIPAAVRGPSGTVLENLFVGAPADLAHPRLIEKCLAMGPACTSSGDDFAPYRATMLELLQ